MKDFLEEKLRGREVAETEELAKGEGEKQPAKVSTEKTNRAK